MSDDKPRIFQIGFNRCGTRTLSRLLSESGLKVAHWKEGHLAKTMATNILELRDPISGYEQYDAFLNMEYSHEPENGLLEVFKDFRIIRNYYENSFFILNTRNVKEWILSRINHPGYLESFYAHYGLNCTDSVIKIWLSDWYNHHAAVIKDFTDMPGNLIIFDIDNDRPERISDFLSPTFRIQTKMRRKGSAEHRKISHYLKVKLPRLFGNPEQFETFERLDHRVFAQKNPG